MKKKPFMHSCHFVRALCLYSTAFKLDYKNKVVKAIVPRDKYVLFLSHFDTDIHYSYEYRMDNVSIVTISLVDFVCSVFSWVDFGEPDRFFCVVKSLNIVSYEKRKR